MPGLPAASVAACGVGPFTLRHGEAAWAFHSLQWASVSARKFLPLAPAGPPVVPGLFLLFVPARRTGAERCWPRVEVLCRIAQMVFLS